jgi:type I restriction enzyme S subunit
MSVFPKYERYKNSGFEWLGEVPEQWDVQSLRAVAGLYVEKNQPDLPVLSVYREYGVILKDSRDDNHNATSLDTSNYKVVRPGDLAVNKMKAWQGSLGVSEHHGIVSPAYITCRLNQEKVTGRYIHYLLRSTSLIGALDSISYGVRVGQWDMRFEDFKKVGITIPPKPEQDRIVAFLDQKTAEIDALIAKKQRQIELLDEQKAILINRAVTRGLNPNAKLKPSGIEWIGDIPEHWEVRRYAHISRIVRGGSPRPAGHPAFFSSESGTPWITVGEVTKKQGQYLTKTREFLTPRGAKQSRFIEPGTLLLSNSGATLGVPTVTKIGGCINDGVLAFLEIDEERCLLDYLYNHLSTLTAFYRDRLKQGSGQPNLNTDLVKDTAVALPPTKREQREICDRIKEIAADAEAIVIAYDRQIQSLKTLRSTLIAHAVTGRIKV